MAIDKATYISKQFGYNIIPEKYTTGQNQGSTTFTGNNSNNDLMAKLNALDGNSMGIYTGATRVSAPVETTSTNPYERTRKGSGYAAQYTNGELSFGEAVGILEANADLLNNEQYVNPETGKRYSLNDNQVHPVYSEKIFDEMA